MPILNASDERLLPPAGRRAVPKLSRVLAPVVFSRECEEAARYAASLARHSGGELMLVHILEPTFPLIPARNAGAPSGEVENNAAYARMQLAAFPSSRLPGLTIRKEVVEGEADQMIVEIADSATCDLIVMATRGLGFIRRLLMRSVSARVLQASPCPVLIGTHLPDCGAPTPPLKNVLCAISLEADSRGLLEWGSWMASQFGCDLTVAHVLPEPPTQLEGARKRIHFDDQWRDALAAAAVCRFNALQRAWGIKYPLQLETGTVPQALRKIADRTGADLLIIGRGNAGSSWGHLRGRAYAIIGESPCPVMAI